MDKTVHTSKDISVTVGLNEERMPVQMTWQAEEGASGQQEVKAMLLSLFEKDSMETIKIDLWTVEMQVMEMDRFVFQTLRGLADTYFKATQNAELATDMQRFVQYFGEKTGVIPGQSS